MLFSWVKLLAIPTAMLTLLQPSTATPIPGTPNIHSNEPQEGHPSSRIMLGKSIERQSNVPCPVIGCKYFQRYPKAVIIPTIMAAETLKAFWTKISIDAMQADIEHINNSGHFTNAAGAVILIEIRVVLACAESLRILGIFFLFVSPTTAPPPVPALQITLLIYLLYISR